MREGWKEVKFGEVVEFPPKIKMVKGNKYPFIPMELIDGGYKYVKPIEEKELAGGGAKFEEGDTLFARITPCLQNGKIAQAKNLNNKPGFGSTEYFIFRGIPNVTENDYVYYLSQMKEFRDNAINSMVGASGRQRADAGHVKSFVFNLPPLETQKKIASILSGYDDLIENNLKRIKILEEMAQQTYEEWFVRMRFPGHESATINSETGLPEGWEKVKLTDFAKITFGYPFKANDFNSEGNGTPIIRIRNIPKSETSDYTSEIVDEKYIVNNGDILIGMDGEFYLNFWTGNNGYLVQRVCRLIACDYLNQGYLLEALKVPINYYQNSIDGATVAHLGKKHLDEIEIVLPNIDLAFFQNLMNQKINLSNQNQRLREARDILLPRLMMGMIEV